LLLPRSPPSAAACNFLAGNLGKDAEISGKRRRDIWEKVPRYPRKGAEISGKRRQEFQKSFGFYSV
jgi:hypothetical protein